MISLIEKVMANTLVSEIKGIEKALLLKNQKNSSCSIQIQGVNIPHVRKLAFIDQESVDTNDVSSILKHFGVRLLLFLTSSDRGCPQGHHQGNHLRLLCLRGLGGHPSSLPHQRLYDLLRAGARDEPRLDGPQRLAAAEDELRDLREVPDERRD